MTVAGNVINDKPLRDITDVLPEILEKYTQRPVLVQMEHRADALVYYKINSWNK